MRSLSHSFDKGMQHACEGKRSDSVDPWNYHAKPRAMHSTGNREPVGGTRRDATEEQDTREDDVFPMMVHTHCTHQRLPAACVV